MRKQVLHFVCLLAAVTLGVISVFAQQQHGQIFLKVRGPKGGPLVASVSLVSEANSVHLSLQTNRKGNLLARDLPFGPYRILVTVPGFLPSTRMVQVHSAVPLTISLTLGLAPVKSSINVTDSVTLVDRQRSRTVYSINSRSLNQQIPAQLGRGVLDAVDSEPGWLFEANGIPHPRESEYDVQFVVDGVPTYQNLSPAYAPPFDAQDVQSVRVMTAGFPAEYGRKLGGVVVVSTVPNLPAGFHMTTEAEGGSFGTASGNIEMGLAEGANQFTLSGTAGVTNRYLSPPVIANYTNHGSDGESTLTYSRNLTGHDHLRLSIYHGDVHYIVPNELVQQEAGQRQDAVAMETTGQVAYDHVISPTLLFSAEGEVKSDAFRLWSNDLSTPVDISQQRGFHRGYGRVALAGSNGIQDWTIGADALFSPVHEALQYTITNPSLFDPGTALHFNFADHKDDIEPAAFAQTSLHLKNWNVNLGIRYDRYAFVVNQSAWSPRVAISHYFPRTSVLLHADYDRVFQTPAMENLLLASSPQVSAISPDVLRLPVEPARANYYEVGVTKGFWGQVRLNVNSFRRVFRNFSDDDTLLNTGVSFPIADASAHIDGVEGKLTMPQWGPFSGSLSYTWQEGIGQGPITGGLFIGSEDIASVASNSRFWISQDQRNTAHASFHYQVTRRLWLATEEYYGSGLPVELNSGDVNYNFLLAQYGPEILSEVDFARGRVRPSYSIDMGAGFDIYEKERKRVILQVQGSNLTNHLNVINFASLFSGTALATPRSFGLRLSLSF